MKGATVFCVIMWAFGAGIYVGKAKGLKEANFDMVRANLKLQQCQDVIKNEKI